MGCEGGTCEGWTNSCIPVVKCRQAGANQAPNTINFRQSQHSVLCFFVTADHPVEGGVIDAITSDLKLAMYER